MNLKNTVIYIRNTILIKIVFKIKLKLILNKKCYKNQILTKA